MKDIKKDPFEEYIKNHYRPHITLGCTKEKIDLSLDEEFESTVDMLSVELIGENELINH